MAIGITFVMHMTIQNNVRITNWSTFLVLSSDTQLIIQKLQYSLIPLS